MTNIGIDLGLDALRFHDENGESFISVASGVKAHSMIGDCRLSAALSKGLGLHHDEFQTNMDSLNAYVRLPAELLTDPTKQATITAASEWLKTTWTFGTITIRSRSAAAIYDMVHQCDGKNSKEAPYVERNVGVICIGHRSLEISGILSGKAAKHMMFCDALGTNSFSLESSTDLDKWRSCVTSFIVAAWGHTISKLDYVLLVGTGAHLAERSLSDVFGYILHVPFRPAFACARGLYKRAVFDAKKANN